MIRANALPKFLGYSSFLHILFVFGVLLSNLYREPAKQYFAVDFIGGLAGGAQKIGKAAESTKIRKAETLALPVPKNAVSKEDLLVPEPPKDGPVIEEEISEIPSVKEEDSSKEETVADIPQAGAEEEMGIGIGFGPSQAGGVSGSGTGNFPYTWYIHSLRKKLDSNWNISLVSGRRIFTQAVFTIAKDGAVKDPDIEESSGNEVFDRAALRAIENSHPFPPLPEDFPEPELRVHVRFTIKM